jgi:hypothetical protein
MEPRDDGRGSVLAVALEAPFACRDFTLRVETPFQAPPRLVDAGGRRTKLAEVKRLLDLGPNTWCREPGDRATVACFDLPRGGSILDMAAV